MFLFLLALAACGGDAPAPKPAPPVVAPAPPPAPPTAPAAVGPDGPESIAVPAGIPKTSAELPTDHETVEKGEKVFTDKGCGACHKFGAKLVGPDLVGIGQRRSPTWISRMILKPEVMIKEDPVARQLFAETMTPMANQNVAEADVLPLIAYIASQKAGAGGED